MRKRVQIALAVLLVAIAGVIGWQVLKPREREPVYQGKPLSSWLIAVYSTTGTPEAQEQANAAVRQLGTNVLPTLLRMLRAKDSPLKVRLMSLVEKQHIIKIRYTPASKWNAATAFGFHALGTNAQSAVPALLEIANQNISLASRDYAIAALGYIGPPAEEAVPSLLRWATNANPTVRACAVQSLGGIGAELDRVVPVLINATRDPYFGVRNNAVVALGHFGEDAKTGVPTLVLPVLTHAVHDPSLSVRFSAIQSLGMLGPDAKLAVPALVELLNDPDADVRGRATNALKHIDPEAAAKAGIR